MLACKEASSIFRALSGNVIGMSKQKGFTLIEVSLAIVIGVIVLAGAITLYNQSRISAGNAKAQAKVLRSANIVETLAAESGGSYPSLDQLRSKWFAVAPDDARTSPWGGNAGREGIWTTDPSVRGILNLSTWPGAPWINDTLGNIDYQGLLAYGLNTSGATQSATDFITGKTKIYNHYIIGIIDSRGNAPCYPVGN
ncbi:hypothetical protein D3C86_1013800 [compost metagenome]